MINLLPSDVKQGTAYGVKNLVLLRWIAAFAIGLIGVGLIVIFGHYQLNQSISATRQQVAQSEQRLRAQNLEETQSQTENIDSSVKLSLQVLEKKVLFSKLLQRIGGIMPQGTILEGLSLSEVEGGITLQAKAIDYHSATQIQVNITDPANNVFEQADILNIDCITEETEATANDPYRCSASFRALFVEDNPYLFINQEVDNEAN